ncbi:DUF3137 domain-containing protein [Cellulomonas humilata]|uniref:DUF3137 domain-containing protein n=1 Tax=Cellulomonas humilata TaxID=144055 RepID=A0ABU0EI45_9CELL|nr:DUF3137 domain-containing protein [Cellulomonas humilata]MDQ0374954.1 hypothetical protein [Cellulomonas humilata]
MNSNTWLILVTLALAVVVRVASDLVARWRSAEARRRRSWAREHGWVVQDEADAVLGRFATSLLGGPRSGRHRRLVDEVLTVEIGTTAVYSFRYSWQSTDDELLPPGDRSIDGHSAHVVGAPLGRAVPMVQVTPVGAVSPFARAFGASDVRFESHAFNEAFRVVSDHPRTAHAVLHPRLMERLLEEPGRSMSWRIEHGWVFTWVDGRTDVEQILPMFEVVLSVRSALPTFVGTPSAPARPVA